MMDSSTVPGCPHCGAPRVPAAECPRCGVIYAKAHAREVAPPPPVEVAPVAAATWDGDAEDAQLEARIRMFALPVALLVAWWMVSSSLGHFIVRTFFAMWLHELGHAVTAWFCGFRGVPLPWFTSISDTREPLFTVALAGGFAWLLRYGWRVRRRDFMAAAGAGLTLQLVCTLLPLEWARALITFGGDAGCFVLGSALMLTLYVRPENPLHRGWLRWGFLAIGAFSFMDGFDTWWGARSDFDRIPFGMMEGRGLSDPSVLTEVYGWTAGQLVRRYVWVGCVCLAVLAVVYGIALFRARARAREA